MKCRFLTWLPRYRGLHKHRVRQKIMTKINNYLLGLKKCDESFVHAPRERYRSDDARSTIGKVFLRNGARGVARGDESSVDNASMIQHRHLRIHVG